MTSASVPTRRNLPSRIATAVAIGFERSRVVTVPLCKMRSVDRLGAFMTAPRRCERLTLYQPVVHGCLAWRRRHVARTAPAATQRRWRFPRSARAPPGRSAHRGECRAGRSARPPEEPATGRRAGYRRLRPPGRQRTKAGTPSWPAAAYLWLVADGITYLGNTVGGALCTMVYAYSTPTP